MKTLIRILAAATAIAALMWMGGCAATPAAEGRPLVAPAHAQGGDWFVQTGCTRCHSATVYGIHTLEATGPDLSIAEEDVKRRFGRTLEDFLHAPTGTMALVLNTVIPMTSQDRDLAIEKLREAYKEYQTSNPSARPVVSH